MKHAAVVTGILAATLAMAGCFKGKQDISAYLASAEQYKQSGDLPKALVSLRTAVRLQPTDPKANLALAQVEDQMGDLSAAVPHYIQAAVPDAHLIEPQLRIVQILIESERFADALGRINTTISAFPGNPDALALRADIEERQGQTTPAKTDAGLALEKNRTNARALSVLAMLKLRNGDAAGANTFVDQGLESHPDNLRLLQVRAAAFLTLNQPDKAVDALKSIIRASPQNVAIHTALADVEAREGRLDQAIANFRAAVVANPGNEDLQLAFVRFLARNNQSSDVVTFIRHLIDSNPKVSNYDLLLAEYFRSRGQLDQAGQVLDQAAARLKEGVEFRSVAVSRAKLDALQGNVTGSLDKLDQVLTADPQNSDALIFRALLDETNGRIPAAIDGLLKVVRADPVNASAFRLLATSYLALDQPKLAADAMQRSVAVTPGDVEAQIQLATFLQRAGQLDATRDMMARLKLQNPTNVAVWTADGQLAVVRKDWNTTARALARLRDLPGTELAVLTLSAQSKAAQGDVAAAVTSYQDALSANTQTDPGLIGGYARAATAAGQSAAAADFLESRVTSLPQAMQQQAWAAIMTMNADAGRFDKADTAFQNAVRLTPSDVALYQGYVRILSAQKKWPQALKVVEAGLSAGCPQSSMLLLRGSIAEQNHNVAAAMQDYKSALQSNPLSLEAANNYGSLLADQDPSNTEALRKARAALSGSENDSNLSVLDTVAWLDYRLGQFDEAKRLLQRANAGQSDNPQIRFHLAATLMASGDREGGLALLDTVKGLAFPGSQEAQKLADT